MKDVEKSPFSPNTYYFKHSCLDTETLQYWQIGRKILFLEIFHFTISNSETYKLNTWDV